MQLLPDNGVVKVMFSVVGAFPHHTGPSLHRALYITILHVLCNNLIESVKYTSRGCMSEELTFQQIYIESQRQNLLKLSFLDRNY